ncbi:MAG: hypothetical protein HZA88_23125 [Verrucomicrobia bacterium]|nr:hypothetical protein [Verrucomicrobiota bacterium]
MKTLFAVFLGVAAAIAAENTDLDRDPAWAQAHLKAPMTADETRAFMKRLAQFVFDNHMKRDAKSAQRGMIYEYFHVERKGQVDQFMQGEGLDTMHDGAWFAAALVHAHRATGDKFYKELLTQWVLPFYLKMLNHGDELFTSERNDGRPGNDRGWRGSKEWLLQGREKGFVPYWWDDGGSVSLDMLSRRDKDEHVNFAGRNELAGQPNPDRRLSGYSFGSSNHMAQDLAVMLEAAWLLLKDSIDPADKTLAAEVAEAAKNLQDCRARHGSPGIPAVRAALAITSGDAAIRKALPAETWKSIGTGRSDYRRALYDFKPGEPVTIPGFADDQEYRYYVALAREGTLAEPAAFRLIYDSLTLPMLYSHYSDDAPAPPGINVFDLAPYKFVDGKPADYRSDRKGPSKRPRQIGSRMGPQIMVCCGWALQALRAYPGIWEERCRREASQDVRVHFDEFPVAGKPLDEMTPLGSVTLSNATLRLVSSRAKLRMDGECKGDATVINIFNRPDAHGSHAVVTLGKDRTVRAVNDKGEPLVVEAEIVPTRDGFKISYLHLPYTAMKGQKAWANGIEHGRCSVQVGDATRNFCLASSERQVAMWLEHELAGGLRTWEAIFDKYGYIPTGIGCHSVLPGVVWDKFSDTGGYAHLLSAAAQWLMYLEKKTDWETRPLSSAAK